MRTPDRFREDPADDPSDYVSVMGESVRVEDLPDARDIAEMETWR